MINLENINKKFDQRGIAGLHDLSLEVDQGEILAIIGPNGSGKTSLLKIIAGSLEPDSGKVQAKKAHFFSPHLPDSDENVQKYLVSKVTLDIHDEKKIQLARDLADIFEITFQLRQKLSELSSGQRQKVLMASELINHPETILMDEPFGHLDPFTRRDILTSLFKYIERMGISLIWVTHEIDEALEFAHRLALMNFGKFEQIGNSEEMVFAPKNLFVAQFMGHKNFAPIKRIDEKSWETSWGNIEIKTSLKASEAYLVIPPHAWNTDEALQFKVNLISKRIKGLYWDCQFQYNDRLYHAHLPHSMAANLKSGDKLSLSPQFRECLVIPL